MLKNIFLEWQECIKNRITSMHKLIQIARIKEIEIEDKVN